MPSWHEQAVCQLFAGDLDWVEAKPKSAQALACRIICAACPVKFECATGALERGEPWGIWGGLDRDDRKGIAKQYGYPAPSVLPDHGTNSRRVKHGCDCRPCKDAHALYERERRERVERERLASMGPRDRQRAAFGRRVQELREANGWTKRRLAHALHMTVPQLGEVEDGRREVDANTVTLIVRAFAADEHRLQLAIELHRAAGTAWLVKECCSRPLLVMTGSAAHREIEKFRSAAATG